jgi:uncharacterized protein (DUF427 family)
MPLEAGRLSVVSYLQSIQWILTLQEQTMPKAIWNGAVIAEALDDEVGIVGGNVYFPLRTVHPEYLQVSQDHAMQLERHGELLPRGHQWRDQSSAAWVYHAPKEAAKQIEGHVAFWRGVEVRQ